MHACMDTTCTHSNCNCLHILKVKSMWLVFFLMLKRYLGTIHIVWIYIAIETYDVFLFYEIETMLENFTKR